MTARRAFVVAGTHILTTLFMTAITLRKIGIMAWKLGVFLWRVGGILRGSKHFWKGVTQGVTIVFFVYVLTVLGWSYGRIGLGLW